MCDLCKVSGCVPDCPNYIPKKSKHMCCYCEEPICDGEEYVINYNDEYIHKECIPSIDFLIDWFDSRIRTMDGGFWGYEYDD